MFIPLQKATLCLDCEVIYQKNGICPNCGSRAGFPVSRWINTVSIISESVSDNTPRRQNAD